MSEESEFPDLFTVNENTGEVFLRRSLVGVDVEQYTVSDNRNCYFEIYESHKIIFLYFVNFSHLLQIRVIVSDRGFPVSLSSSAIRVIVSVERNENAPVFDDAPFVRAINEDHEVDSIIFTVLAEDEDERVRYV